MIKATRIESGLVEMEEQADALKTKIDAWVLDHEQYEDDMIRITRVQGFRRTWNIDKLESILPRATFRKIVKIDVDKDKLDDLVRANKIDRDAIAPAFDEQPNKPYAKWTPVKQSDGGAAEADSLADKLA